MTNELESSRDLWLQDEDNEIDGEEDKEELDAEDEDVEELDDMDDKDSYE